MTQKELLDKAIDFIVETQKDNDYICEQMVSECIDDWCENNCQNLNKECVRLFLKNVYKYEENTVDNSSGGSNDLPSTDNTGSEG